MFKLRSFSPVLASLAALGLTINAHAQTTTNIPVTNFSFETDNTGTNGYTGSLTGWTQGGNSGTQSQSTYPSLYPSGIPNGTQYAYINSSYFYQNLPGTVTVTAGSTYTLSAFLGNRSDAVNNGGIASGSFTITAVGGTEVANSGVKTPALGTFTSYSTSYTPTVGDASIGKTLSIGFFTNGGQINVDNVRFTVTTPAPEPSQTAALSLGGLALSGLVFVARRRRALSVV